MNVVHDHERVAWELVERLTYQTQERTHHIAGFYTVIEDRIAAAKIYREGSPEPE